MFLSGGCFSSSRTALLIFAPSAHLLPHPSSMLLYASLWMWHRGTIFPPLSCPEVLVECREWCALGCLSPWWKMEGWHRYRSRWHCMLGIIFSDKLGLGLKILAFACCSHSHQNITMKIKCFCRKDMEILNYMQVSVVGSCCKYTTCMWHFFIKQKLVSEVFFFVFVSLGIPINVFGQWYIRKLQLSM